MPIYEFRCANCGSIQEFIFTGSDDNVDIKCRECNGEELERVLSSTNYSMGGSSGSCATPSGASSTTRTCGPGRSCTSIELPGHKK
jgi:putative FmdB family regulatory protein